MTPYTTLRRVRAANACTDRYAHLRKALGPNYGDDTPIPLVTVLEINGLEDVLWIPVRPEYKRLYLLFNVACCIDVWDLMMDQRSRDAVRITHLYAHGEATEEELDNAARAAARAAYATSAYAAYAADAAPRAARAVDVAPRAARAARAAVDVADAAYAAYAVHARQVEHFKRIFS